MKQWILTLSILMGASLAMAGTFKANDFNEMMKENQKIEQDLRNQLQKEAGISLDDQPGYVARDKAVAPVDPEQVVVSSSTLMWHESKTHLQKPQEKDELKRISQELDDAQKN